MKTDKEPFPLNFHQGYQASESRPPMPLHEDQVREALKKVIDPELFINIVDLGLIYVIDVKECEGEADRYDVDIEMTMTSPMCPAGPQLVAETRKYAGELEGVENVEVKVVMDPPWTQDMMTDDARDQLGIF
jgi:metal-sulfur cluster biosynthetic enzyme